MKGIIIKNQNGYFSIFDNDQKIHLSRSRGRLKRKTNILVGDKVSYELTDRGDATIISVFPRRTLLSRPPVANVDQLVITVSIQSPDINLYILDKMLLLAEDAGIYPLICINKSDLDWITAGKIAEIYRNAGYVAICVSAAARAGIDSLREHITGRIVAFSGPSGVGKSSLLNCLLGSSNFEEGEISTKTGRGKNTTRHAELISFSKHSFLMDTPGYTSLSLEHIDLNQVGDLFPEFQKYLGQCRFHDCRHIKEPDCAVREALGKGNIAMSRWRSYCQVLEEIQESVHRY